MKLLNVVALVLAAAVATAATTASAASYTYPNGVKATATLSETGKGWPECSPGTEQWSGTLDISSATNKHYFYWAFGPRTRRPDAPVILWMTGGPGCSSSLAVLVENGPCHVNLTTGNLYQNPYAWNDDAYVIYIDQPAGVGFSYADKSGYDHNEAGVSIDMYHFLQDIFKKHPNFANSELFIFGESYGGHFAPATAHRVYEMNKSPPSGSVKLPLKGLAVGNGLTAPYIQYKYYEQLAYNWCIVKLGKPCVTKAVAQQMNSSIPSCIALIDACMADPTSTTTCSMASNVCNGGQFVPYTETGRNVYDIQKPCIGPLCYDFSKAVEFMNRADVQVSMGVKPQKWQSCNMDIYQGFGSDWFQTFDGYVAAMLNDTESGIRVMIYAGDLDFICNWIGNKAWTLNLDWTDKRAFNLAPDRALRQFAVRSVPSAVSPIHFSFVQVHNAGHMVPMDQPAAILNAVTSFLTNQEFHE